MFPDLNLYGEIIYLYKEEKNLDADNISKPIWDALKGVAFHDDNQIKIRSVVSLNMNQFQIYEVDMDGIIDADLIYDILNSINGNDHTLYIHAGEIETYTNIFKISSLWK